MDEGVKELPAEQSATAMLHSSPESWLDTLNLSEDSQVEAQEEPLVTEDLEAPTGDPGAEAADEQEAEAEAEAEGEVEAKAEGDEPDAEPEAEVEEKAPEKPKRITEFSAFDAEGEVELPPIEIEFKANGAVRKMPLDKVVRLAQSGFYNEEQQEAVREFREKEPAYQKDIEELTALAQRQASLIREVMEDEEKYLKRQEEFKQSQSPEARAARAEAQLRAERQRVAQIESGQRVNAFLSQVGPRVDGLVAEYPTVTEEEAAGWLAPQLKRLERNGVIPPERLPDVERLVTVDLAEWLSQKHETRTAKQTQEAEKRKLSLRKVQVEATKAKQKLARAAAPTRTATTSSTKDTTKAPRSAREANDAFWAQEMGS